MSTRAQAWIAVRAFIKGALRARAVALSIATRLIAAAASTVSFNRNWPASERIGKLCDPYVMAGATRKIVSVPPNSRSSARPT